jgi:hypothetical protein
MSRPGGSRFRSRAAIQNVATEKWTTTDDEIVKDGIPVPGQQMQSK